MMTPVLAAATLLTLQCLYVCQIAHFVVGALTEARIENNSCRYDMSSTPEIYGARPGLVFVAIESCKAGQLPNMLKGPMRIAPDRDRFFAWNRTGDSIRRG
jgi:hypothetical protein